jgi:hypothetical protein
VSNEVHDANARVQDKDQSIHGQEGLLHHSLPQQKEVMITLSILIVAIVCVAYMEASDDYNSIVRNIPITHVDPGRYIVCAVWALVLAAFAQTWWALLYFPITWAVFTISFRFLLNRKRGMDWRYISPSNGYDWFWMRATSPNRFVNGLREKVKTHFAHHYENTPAFRKGHHRAGAFAYAFEALLVLVPSITIYITKTL